MDPTMNALMASGFPFQTAVASVIPRSPAWSVVAEEFPWRDVQGNDHFLDIVAESASVTLTVECKKTRNESLIFLHPRLPARETKRVRCIYREQIQDATRRVELFCADWEFSPSSAEAAYCVVSTSASGRDQRLLERDAHLVAKATDEYAKHHVRANPPVGANEPYRPIVPTIVTNAKLLVAQYDPATISLASGELRGEEHATLVGANYVRFRKAFGSSRGHDLGARTVFVVHADALLDFLSALATTGTIPSPDGKTQLPKDRH